MDTTENTTGLVFISLLITSFYKNITAYGSYYTNYTYNLACSSGRSSMHALTICFIQFLTNMENFVWANPLFFLEFFCDAQAGK
jgi:hypothetical protein